MTFRSPWLLGFLVLIPGVIAFYVMTRKRRVQRAAQLAEQGLVTTALPSKGRVRRHVPFGLFVAALTLLVVGIARPMTTIKTPRREATVILAMDVSNSMKATDVQPSRIDAAKAAAKAFVDRQPTGVKIGVVAFGDGAVVVQTPTNAHVEIDKAIDRLTPEGGTSVGQGLVTSLSAIAGKPLVIDPQALASDAGSVDIGYFGSSSIVLLSDGEETAPPDPENVAEVASVAGVRIHTIGVGTDKGGVVDINGFSIATALNRDLLQHIATTTNGSYHEGTDANGLAAVSKTIDLKFKIVKQHTEVTGLFSAAGAVLLMAGAVLSVLWFGRVL